MVFAPLELNNSVERANVQLCSIAFLLPEPDDSTADYIFVGSKYLKD